MICDCTTDVLAGCTCPECDPETEVSFSFEARVIELAQELQSRFTGLSANDALQRADEILLDAELIEAMYDEDIQ